MSYLRFVWFVVERNDVECDGVREAIRWAKNASYDPRRQTFITDKGIVIKAGCFMGFIDEFMDAVGKTHGDTDHAKEYAKAILMIETHAAVWANKASSPVHV